MKIWILVKDTISVCSALVGMRYCICPSSGGMQYLADGYFARNTATSNTEQNAPNWSIDKYFMTAS